MSYRETPAVPYQCQEPTCGGLARLRRSDSFCTGVPGYRHRAAEMWTVVDEGQEETANLILNDYDWCWSSPAS